MRQESSLPSIQNKIESKDEFNGYNLSNQEFKVLLEREYPALRDTCYLDSAASPPPPISTLNSFSSALSRTLYSNPHSLSHSSNQTSQEIDSIRSIILSDLFSLTTVQDRNHWDLIFTSGATSACKSLAQSFPWSKKGEGVGSHYRYLKESHTSLVGIRGVALAQDANVEALDVNEVDWLDDDDEPSLFAYPAQCNATGARLGLNYGSRIKSLHPNTFVLLDAAAYLSTTPLKLNSLPLDLAPDFIVCSFYKLFGYPTGLGCLLVKRSSASILRPPHYFGGGTISFLTVGPNFHHESRLSSSRTTKPSPSKRQTYPTIHDGFEDGTLPFLNIIALGHALETHKKLYKSHLNVSDHTTLLAKYALEEMSKLQHGNGTKIFQHHLAFSNYPLEFLDFGPTIAFTLLDPSFNPIGHVHLERLATLNGIQLRSGGLCNTGVLNSVLNLNDKDRSIDFTKGRVCWDEEEFGGEFGKKSLGISRISFGAMNSKNDVEIWISFLRKYFIVPETRKKEVEVGLDGGRDSGDLPECYLSGLMLYPIKSCGGQRLSTPSTSLSTSTRSSFTTLGWEVISTGLRYDREWTLIHSLTSKILSQKQFPKMALIEPRINLETHKLEIIVGRERWEIDLDDETQEEKEKDEEEIGICGDSVLASRGSSSSTTREILDSIDKGLSEFLGVPCRLLRYSGGSSTSTRHGHFDSLTPSTTTVTRPTISVPILLSNESPFLCISTRSVEQVSRWIQEDLEGDEVGEGGEEQETRTKISSDCFRANFIFSSRASSSSSTSSSSPVSTFTAFADDHDEIDYLEPFLEDKVDFIKIGTETFSILAKCRRCLMVCVNQETGIREKEPFSSLARHRKSERGRIEFGVHLIWRKDLSDLLRQEGSAEVGRVKEGDKVSFGFCLD